MHSNMMFAICVLLTALAASSLIGQDSQRQTGMAEAQSTNFIVYREAVREYIMNHSGHTGIISESDLDLPRTYKNMGWNSEADSGEAWVYGDMAPEGLRRTVEKMDQPISVGQKEGGVLVSPVYGNTSIAVPGFVAAGHVAAVIKNS